MAWIESYERIQKNDSSSHRDDKLLLCNLCVIESYIIMDGYGQKAYLPATGTSLNKKKEAPGGGPVIALRQR